MFWLVHIKNTSLLRFYTLLLWGALLASCSDQDNSYEERSVEDLYSSASQAMDSSNYVRAAKGFAEIERQHPYSNAALKAQLLSAYCYYEARKYEEAIEGFTVFIQLHPTHKDVDYAHYMLGMCYYEQMPIIERDQKPTEKSLSSFQELLDRFPNSSYAKDAKLKIDLIQDHLAAKELALGRYYQRKSNYLAAAGRFQRVVKVYQTTSHVPEALYRLVECYLSLNIKSEAKICAVILQHNYPGSRWYDEAYNLIKTLAPGIL
jgi:outer membrane protein assembly factor BamD